ncbi:MAG: thiaminase II [candidate division Zixibacteria bacterium]|nr:thiaminase II [candidate division Zixibacteria bacterium]NIR66420.1 thiaminase II [candidate division Zixibacteria bacterium]NIS18064.1 thiaminase II [candidate division Zixibacteria bacterium]NIS48010.1 thiaminase II [candidate division Zixibacteria bacterium]NIT54344.1 thiaminase II [candidate division Zixibacteria bacterium]
MLACDKLRKNAEKIWEANFNHPFVQGIGDGSLDKEIFKYYLKQDYVYLIAFSRFFGLATAKGDRLEQMQMLSKVLEATLNIEMDLHRQICADFDISPEELERTKPSPICLAYTSYLLSTAYQGSTAEVITVLLPCSWGYVEIAHRLKEKGLPDDKHYRQWIETYSSQEFWDLNEWLKSEYNRLVEGISDIQTEKLQEIFNYSSMWEYMFWEMAYKQQDWPIEL